ncbi:LUD domain-containing protein [Oceanithermus sp.]|uniref:LutC/YkgG family protein n=1 Tax=Oceanithermus sp. TaxID=2268145 RepID=UPI00338E4194
MPDAKHRILRRVRRALAGRWPVEAPTGPWRPAVEAAGAVERFLTHAEAAGVEARRFESPDAARAWLSDWAAAFKSAATSPRVPAPLAPPLPAAPPEEADLGVSRALAAVADTGSVLLSSAEGRRLQLLPPAHLVWVDEAEVVQHLGEVLGRLADDPPSALALHSGPSKSADIGQIMVQGVHGPGRLAVAVVRGLAELEARPAEATKTDRGPSSPTPDALDWEAVRALEGRRLATKRGDAFTVEKVTENTAVVRVGSSGKTYTLRRRCLEKAAHLAAAGTPLPGPVAYRKLACNEAPAYAWAVLRALGRV